MEEKNGNQLWSSRFKSWTRKPGSSSSLVEEIHQQLSTNHKLFCKCNPIIRRDNADFTFLRRLRPTQSELGEVDPAALFEFEKGKKIIYEGYADTTCLVEVDNDFN